MTANVSLRSMLKGLVAPVYLPVLLLSFSWSALAPSFPQYLAGLGAGVTVVGLVVAMKGIGQVASDLPGGLMLANWGERRITMISYVVAITSNLILFWIRSVLLIGFLTFASGFATSILLTTVMTLVRRTVPADSRGRALSGVGGALRTGMFLGPLAGGFLAERFGVPVVFLMRTALLIGGMSSFALGHPRETSSLSGARSPGHATDRARSTKTTKEPSATAPPPGGVQGGLLGAFAPVFQGLKGRWYAVGTVGFVILALSILRTAREVIMPLWGEGMGLSVSQIGVAMSLGAAFDLLLFVPAGIISDKRGRRTSLGLCLTLFSAGLLLLLPARSFALFVAAGILVGLGNGLGAGINMTTGTDLAPPGAVSEFLGIWRLYGDLGNAAGPILVGALTAAIALGPAVALTATIGGVGALVTVLLVPETKDLSTAT
ncbi:MAG: MFS transporter [Spirochaetaceae bacterium]